MTKTAVHLSLVIFFLILFGCAGVPKAPDARIERIVEAPGFSKDQIYSSCKIWIAENFKSAKAVMEYDNKEEGTIIGNGVIPYPCSGMSCWGMSDWQVPFTMRTDIKDQKFRLTFSNIRVTWPPAQSRAAYDGPMSQKGIDLVAPVLLKFGDEITASMKNNKAKSDW